MLIKILDYLIYNLSNIRNKILDKQQQLDDEFAWMNEAAKEYENYSL